MYLKSYCFMKTVTTAGTQVQLTTSDIRVPAIIIQAERSNTGYIYIGDSEVSSSNYGVDLGAADSQTITSQTFGLAGATISLKDIWIDASVSTDGVSVLYLERGE